MSKQPKPKASTGEHNTTRKNGKAPKKNPGQHNGGRKNPLSETQKVLMNKGLASKWRDVVDGKVRGI